MCSKVSSLVLFTNVLEFPLAMVLTTIVLLVIDRRPLGTEEEGMRRGGGGGAWVVGHPPWDAISGVGEVRRRVSTCLVRFLALFLFLPFPSYVT
jgi:hypothetical protein